MKVAYLKNKLTMSVPPYGPITSAIKRATFKSRMPKYASVLVFSKDSGWSFGLPLYVILHQRDNKSMLHALSSSFFIDIQGSSNTFSFTTLANPCCCNKALNLVHHRLKSFWPPNFSASNITEVISITEGRFDTGLIGIVW